MKSPFFPLDAARIIYHDGGIIGFYDAYPVSPGHALVIAEELTVSIFDLPEERQAALWRAVDEVREMLRLRHGPDGFTIGVNDGPAAGQTISHGHIHVIPRYKGDVPDPRGGIRWVIPDKAVYWKETGA